MRAGRVGGVATSLSFDAAADSPGAGAAAAAGAGDALPPIDHKSKAMAAYLQDGRTPDPSEVRATFFSTRISLGSGASILLCHSLSLSSLSEAWPHRLAWCCHSAYRRRVLW